MNSEFINKSDERWHAVKEVRDHDFYHLPEYVALDSKLTNGTPVCWVAETAEFRAWIPLIKRRIPDCISKGKNYFDLTSPYGFSGILFDVQPEPYELNRLIWKFNKDAARNNYITSFLRMNPISNPFTWQQNDLIEQVYHGYTITVPLNNRFETIRKGYSSNHKKNIKQLQREGFIFSMDTKECCKAFIPIYEETMNRLNASKYYFFPEKYFEILFKILGSNIHLAMVYDKCGNPAAGGIITDFNGILQSHLTATRTSYLRDAPSKLLFDGVIKWAANSGRKWLHLGGGLNSKEDSLYRFKKGFSSIKNQFSTLHIIHDKQRYNNLNYVALNEGGKKEFEDPDFFPLYRQFS